MWAKRGDQLKRHDSKLYKVYFLNLGQMNSTSDKENLISRCVINIYSGSDLVVVQHFALESRIQMEMITVCFSSFTHRLRLKSQFILSLTYQELEYDEILFQ